MNESLTKKLLIIGGLLLLMLIPLRMVNGIIEDRQENKAEAIKTISNAWSDNQVIVGPVLTIPTKSVSKDKDGKTVTEITYYNFFPEELNISGEVAPEIRYKGIFEHPVFTADLKINGHFNNFDITTTTSENILWEKAFITIGFSDQKGVYKTPELLWNNEPNNFNPGTYKQNNIQKGVHSFVKLSRDNKKVPFVISLSLKGSDALLFQPIARENKVSLASSWTNPNFTGSFLPIAKSISQDGFEAKWDISRFAFNYGTISTAWDSAFGVSLLLPVDSYRNALRATKYGILFLALTFMACFLFEVIGKLKIHPFQYSLVGLALVIFYLLLVSFSEFIGFIYAYIIASLATISLIALYTHFSLIKRIRPAFTAVMTTTLVLLYSYLYVLLQLQDSSLLFGSIGAFLAVAALMYFTRDINWYENQG